MTTSINPSTGIIEEVLPEDHEASQDLRTAHAELQTATAAYRAAIQKRLDAVERYADGGGGAAGVARILNLSRPRGFQLITFARERNQ